MEAIRAHVVGFPDGDACDRRLGGALFFETAQPCRGTKPNIPTIDREVVGFHILSNQPK